MVILLIILAVNVSKSQLSDSTGVIRKNEKLLLHLMTDKASYQPKDSVYFTAYLAEANGELEVTYYHLNRVVSQQKLKVQQNEVHWKWEPPEKDFKGYLVQVVFQNETKKDQQTIAVDVSSDWSKFPRYGFLSQFYEMSYEDMDAVISQLNRYHINGLQFYDWHYKHHHPIKWDKDGPASNWEDIANRPISLKTLKTYINLAHDRNMKTMAYNLLYGAFAEAEKDGVKTEWRVFKDTEKNAHDYHPLPKDWKSDVFLVNPANIKWQEYIIQQQKNVYKALPFDGWHIDQLGSRGEVFDYDGNPLKIDETFQAFLNNVKNNIPDKRLVMNAVNQHGQKQIGQSPVDFLYTEVWDPYKEFSDLKRIIDENTQYSQEKNNTVLAAYMNYEFSNQTGVFNMPGILLANSVIFASGGSHLELGEHMLSKEYFPHNNLQMDNTLKKRLIHYYDFLVAYENLLRDNVQEVPVIIQSTNWVHFSSQPEQGKIWTFAKEKNNKQKVIHMINFFDATTLEWRDTNGIQAEPENRKQLSIQLEENRPVKKIWFASPDKKQGIPIALPFNQENNKLTFTIPSLKYWDMIVIEFE